MRPSLFLLALASFPVAAHAQAERRPWRFGFQLNAPARVLKSGPSTITLGIGEGLEVARVLGTRERLRGVALVRINSAPVNGEGGGGSWTAGRAFIIDLSVRAERAVSTRIDLFGGAGISHWSGPGDTAPFAGAAGILYAAELGGSASIGSGPWRGSATVHITQFGPDDERQMQSGAVFRALIGVHRDY